MLQDKPPLRNFLVGCRAGLQGCLTVPAWNLQGDSKINHLKRGSILVHECPFSQMSSLHWKLSYTVSYGNTDTGQVGFWQWGEAQETAGISASWHLGNGKEEESEDPGGKGAKEEYCTIKRQGKHWRRKEAFIKRGFEADPVNMQPIPG